MRESYALFGADGYIIHEGLGHVPLDTYFQDISRQ
jgi:hypothetical protein